MASLVVTLLAQAISISVPPCTVVYDGDPGVLEHEIAHCWGWKHGADKVNSTIHRHPRAPIAFRKPYPNVVIHKARKPALLCARITGDKYDTPYLRTVRGCSMGGV